MVDRITSANPEIAVLQTQMVEMQSTSARIESKVDAMDGKFDHLLQTLDERYATQKDYVSLRNDFIAFKRQYWLSHTLTALLSAFMTSTIGYIVLNGLGKLQ